MQKENITYLEPILIKDLGIKFYGKSLKYKERFGLFRCQCGKSIEVPIRHIKSGHTKSCGCHRINNSRNMLLKHGMSKHPIFMVWAHIINRCSNIKDKRYSSYGGRGIIICDRWLDVANFIEDMYPTFQEGLSIDRINNDGNYEPSNCRWTSNEVQQRNTRRICSTNTSGYRGVSRYKKTDKWRARIFLNSKEVFLGLYNTPIDAAKAYDTYVIYNNLEHTINEVL